MPMRFRWGGAIPLAGACALLTAQLAAGQPGYYSHPDIHGDTIVFVSEEDLWRVPADGGLATRLTTGPAVEMMPRFSPDGSLIAFSSSEDGNMDVYVMPATGGEPVRLTWRPGSDYVTDWTPDGGSVVFYSQMYHPHFGGHAFTVPAGGGAVAQLPLGRATTVSFHADGTRVAFNRLARQFRTFKRYLGGTQDDVWIADLATGDFTQFTEFPGNDAFPMWVGDRVYFVSERDGRRNLWSLDEGGGGLRQHTAFDDFDVHWPQTDGRDRIVFQHGADILLFDTGTDTSRVVDIVLASSRPERRLRTVDVPGNTTTWDLAPGGERVLLTSRGQVVNFPAEKGRTITLSAPGPVRDRAAYFAGKDGEKVVFWSDRTGEEELYVAGVRSFQDAECITCGEQEPTAWRFDVSVAPDGDKIAWADRMGTLFWTSLSAEEREIVTIDDSDIWETTMYTWSPDSRYLAYAQYDPPFTRRVKVYDTDEAVSRDISDPMYDSYSPAWSLDGKYLFYLSDRTFDPLYGQYDWNTVLLPMTRPYMVLLAEDSENPYWAEDYYEKVDREAAEEAEKEAEEAAEVDEAGADEAGGEAEATEETEVADAEDAEGDDAESEDPESDEENEEEDKDKIEVVIDWQGIEGRTVALANVEPANLWGLGAADGRLYYMYRDLRGGTGAYGASRRTNDSELHTYDYTDDDGKPDVFATNVSGYAISRDGKKILLGKGGAFHVAATGKSFQADKAEKVPTGDAPLHVDPAAEWTQIYDELYRMYREFFYTADMAGTDWKEVHGRYRPLLERIATRRELRDLMGHVVGELGTGHTYVSTGGDIPRPRTVPTGMLGADIVYDPAVGAHVIERIYRGYSWDSSVQSPLARPHVDVREGELLLAIDGVELDAGINFEQLLYNKRGVSVVLTVKDTAEDAEPRDVRVETTGWEAELRYQDWVNRNREYVHEQSDGRMAYIHIPNMSARGLVEFYRQWYPQLDRQFTGLVVDVRFNGGGNVSPMIIENLNRVLYAMTNVRNFRGYTYPRSVFHGHMVCLTNERAGSDGDIFCEQFRLLGLGPIIGTRTWGGTVGIRGGRNHVDGSVTQVPEYGFWDFLRGFDMENSGVTPDIIVDNTPADEAAGRDVQLDRAIAELEAMLAAEPVTWPEKPAPGGNSLERFRQRAAEWMDKP